jgi:phosphate starvation-inducible protein PhoH and related proteins
MMKSILPRNLAQQKYIELLNRPKPYIVVASGPAGSGKTILATHSGVEKLREGVIDKLVITRPAVSVDESHGFLPGSLEEKMGPWVRPVFDVLQLHYPRAKIDKLIKDDIIEISPLAYMRGRTFEKSWIICDEAQNTTVNQLLMVLTRIGNDSKLIITGDPNQHDRGFDVNGLNDFIQRMTFFNPQPDIEHVSFSEQDVERHPVIPVILKMYK